MDITGLGIATVATITVLSGLIGQIVKASGVDNKWIPIVCGIVGALFGILGMRTIPDFPAGDYLSASAVGIVSGLAATGLHQAYKQQVDKGA